MLTPKRRGKLRKLAGVGVTLAPWAMCAMAMATIRANAVCGKGTTINKRLTIIYNFLTIHMLRIM